MTTPYPTERIVGALAQRRDTDAARLLSQMNRCETDEWRGHFTCRTAACTRCRGRYIGNQCRRAVKRFASVQRADLSMLSVVIAASSDVEDIGSIFGKFRKDLRNAVDGRRRDDRRWQTFQSLLWLETDAVSADDFVNLGTDKKEQLGEMAPFFIGQDGPVWVVTTHGVASHPGIDHQEVRRVLAHRWQGHNQVHVAPFFEDADKDVSLRRIINYSLKGECRSYVGGAETPWPPSWAATYYAYLNGWSRSFQSHRISISPMGVKKNLPVQPYGRDTVETFDESDESYPMPFLYDNSILPTYYN